MGLILQISKPAEHDLAEVFDYTYSEHGTDQAVVDVSSFDDLFRTLLVHPEMDSTGQKSGQVFGVSWKICMWCIIAM